MPSAIRNVTVERLRREEGKTFSTSDVCGTSSSESSPGNAILSISEGPLVERTAHSKVVWS
jgi:hypothetical protein